jgi:hypothetical protein
MVKRTVVVVPVIVAFAATMRAKPAGTANQNGRLAEEMDTKR